MNNSLLESNIKFVTDENGKRYEVIIPYEQFLQLKELLVAALPERDYDLTDAIKEGIKEIGEIQRSKTRSELSTLREFLDEL